MATDVFVHPFVILDSILEEPFSIQEVSLGSVFTHEARRGMRGATGSVVRFIFRDAQSTAGRTGEVGTAAVGADEEVAAEDEADEAVAVPEPKECLIGVECGRGERTRSCRSGPSSVDHVQYMVGLAEDPDGDVVSCLRSAELPPTVWLRWLAELVLDPFFFS